MREGLRYVWNWPGLLALMIMAAVVNPVFSLLPLYVSQCFGGEAMQLGWMQSAQGVGLSLGGCS